MYYVYIHKKPSGEVFYVGKGKKNRAWSRHSRNAHWLRIVEKYSDYQVEIVEKDIQEWYAFELEMQLVLKYGLKDSGGTLCNKTLGGEGASGHIPSEEVRKKISEKASVSGNGRYNSTIYKLINIETKETFQGTKFEFEEKYNFNIRDVTSGRVKTSMAWTLQEIYDATPDLKPKRDIKTYDFIHKSGQTFTGTRQQFKDTVGFDPKNLFKSEKYRNKVLHGWSVILTFQN